VRDGHQSPLQAIRRNHALEHATLHVLKETCPDLRLAGRSDWSGFWVYGQVSTDTLTSAATAALQKLQNGEADLAIHPQCGTNLMAGIALVALASEAALRSPWRPLWRRVVLWMMGIGAALALAKPLGSRLQRSVTTWPNVDQLRVVSVREKSFQLPRHHVQTASDSR
jgi:hypothetical protein